MKGLALKLVGLYSAPGRDPRGWVVSAAYAARVEPGLALLAGDDAASARWYPLSAGTDGPGVWLEGQFLPGAQLAFDHGKILADALQVLGISL